MIKTASRRTFLRGLGGSTLALPWLESIAAPRSKPMQRFALFYVPIGVVRKGFFPGEAEATVPKFAGGNGVPLKKPGIIEAGTHEWNLTPTQEPLAGIKDKMSFLSGLDRTYLQGTDVHAQCASCFLSSATPTSVKDSPYPLDRTLDHLIADSMGGETPFRSLEFSCNSHRDNKESIQFDNISWYGTGHVAPSIRDPRKAYERLFGVGEAKTYLNITDLVLEDAKAMQRNLGYRDREKFGEYFDSIRTIEEQISKLEKMRNKLSKVAIEEPPEAHLPRGEYIRLMGDLMVAALQAGLTQVATFMVGPERWDTPFTYDSLFDKPMSHHKMSHNQREFLDQLLELDRFHMEQFAYMAQKMDAIPEADGSTLLDNTLFTYGSGLGDGSTHQYSDLPIIVAGSGGGKFQSGKHIHFEKGTPLANLWLTQAQAMGSGMKRFADSSGILKQALV